MFVAVLEAVVVCDQHRIRFQRQSEHVKVNVREPCIIARSLRTGLSLSPSLSRDGSPLEISRIHQKGTSLAQALKFSMLRLGTDATSQLSRRPMEQRRCVQHPNHAQMNRTPPMKAPLTPIFMKGSRQGTP